MALRRSNARVAGLDIGTSFLKAVSVEVDPTGQAAPRLLALRRAATPAEAADLVATALRLLREVETDAGPVAAIGIASMAETGVPLDARGDALTALLTWDAARPLSSALDDLDPGELFARTGVRLSPKMPLATWAWLAAEHPDVHRRMRRWAGAADLVAHALTGRLATDHTLADRTGAHLLHEGGWDDGLLDLAGLRADALPEVTRPDEPVGYADGIAVSVAGHDHRVGAHVSGLRSPGDAVNSLGTSEVVIRLLVGDPDADAVRKAGVSLVRTVDGRLALLAGNGSAGAAYAAWVERHGLAGAESEPAGEPTGLLVLPYLRGRQCPEPDPGARMRAVGELGAAPSSMLVTAVLEGLALHTRWMYDTLRDLDPGTRERAPLTVFGGPGARNAAWTAVKAGVLPDGIRVVDQHEPVAVGAAVVGAERAGLVEPGATVLPAGPARVPEDDRYAATYKTFVHEARRRERSE